MNRPTGVTIIAIFHYLCAALLILAGIGFIVGGGMLGSILSTAMSQSGSQVSGTGMTGLMAGLGAVFAVIFFVCAAISALLGWGLWALKNWARIIVMVFSILDVLLCGLGVLLALVHFSVLSILWNGFWLALYGAIVWYLMQPAVKQVFEGGGRRVAATA